VAPVGMSVTPQPKAAVGQGVVLVVQNLAVQGLFLGQAGEHLLSVGVVGLFRQRGILRLCLFLCGDRQT